MLTSYKRKTPETSRGPGRIGLQRVNCGSTMLPLCNSNHHEVLHGALRSEHVGPEESELPNEWQDECQVACIDKHTCIDKFELKACIKNRVMSTDIQEQVRRQ